VGRLRLSGSGKVKNVEVTANEVENTSITDTKITADKIKDLMTACKDKLIDKSLLPSLEKDLNVNDAFCDFVFGDTKFIKAWEFVIEGATIRIKPEILEKISIALNRGVKEIPDVVSHANHPNIVTYTVEHIFRGHGANGGRHHISALIADKSKKLTDRLKETGDGFYEAVFKNADGTTSTKSFWPDTWDENRIMDELKHVMANNPTNIPGTNNWVGYTTTNQKIIYYVKSSDNSIISAFPEL
jgi:Bacterial EndoU nuclease